MEGKDREKEVMPGLRRYDQLLKKQEAILRNNGTDAELKEVEAEIAVVKKELGLDGDPLITPHRGDKVRILAYTGCSEELLNIAGKVGVVIDDAKTERYAAVRVKLSTGKVVMVPRHCLQHAAEGRVRQQQRPQKRPEWGQRTPHSSATFFSRPDTIRRAVQRERSMNVDAYTVHGYKTDARPSTAPSLSQSRVHVTLSLLPEVPCDPLLTILSSVQWSARGLHQDTLRYNAASHAITFDISAPSSTIDEHLKEVDRQCSSRTVAKRNPLRGGQQTSTTTTPPDLPNPSPSTSFTETSPVYGWRAPTPSTNSTMKSQNSADEATHGTTASKATSGSKSKRRGNTKKPAVNKEESAGGNTAVAEELRMKLTASQAKVHHLQTEVHNSKVREKQLQKKLDEKTVAVASLTQEANRRKEKSKVLSTELEKVTEALDAIMNTLSACGAQWAEQLSNSGDPVASRMSRGVLSELLATNHEVSEKLRQLNTLSRVLEG
eukprot:TRINITY_DN42049_c0_g1_i1.p1 TRINITY_DN42049_c0_g1~~TRINITY_DN42049_c0_g1_i1.p1  ORF type:complete len:556 (+),score=88.53 TRINITY_DN42049_c0_g1_i1:193-1668(+)